MRKREQESYGKCEPMGTHQSKLWKNARCCCVTCFINSLKKKWLFTCLEYYPASPPPPPFFPLLHILQVSSTVLSFLLHSRLDFDLILNFFFFGVHNATSYNSVIMCSIHNAIPCQNNNYDIFLEISNDFSNKT